MRSTLTKENHTNIERPPTNTHLNIWSHGKWVCGTLRLSTLSTPTPHGYPYPDTDEGSLTLLESRVADGRGRGGVCRPWSPSFDFRTKSYRHILTTFLRFSD